MTEAVINLECKLLLKVAQRPEFRSPRWKNAIH
jgi:hypothetical protein